MLHHQSVREVGIASGILKPIAGKQYGGSVSLPIDSVLLLPSVCLLSLFAPYFFIVRAHCTCSTARDPSSTAINASVRVKNIMVQVVENQVITIVYMRTFIYLRCSWQSLGSIMSSIRPGHNDTRCDGVL